MTRIIALCAIFAACGSAEPEQPELHAAPVAPSAAPAPITVLNGGEGVDFELLVSDDGPQISAEVERGLTQVNAETVAFAQDIINDPNASDDAKHWARRLQEIVRRRPLSLPKLTEGEKRWLQQRTPARTDGQLLKWLKESEPEPRAP